MNTLLDILLVEDNEGDVEMTRRALRTSQPACSLVVANNGDQAMQLLQDRAAEGLALPQLILLDINMPRMDGKAFLGVVKHQDAFKAIPVVMFTSSESPADIRECYERHAAAYVVKPFDGVKYAGTLREVVRFWGETSQLAS